MDSLPVLYCSPGAPYGLVHFTEYPPNPVHSEFTLEEILIHGPKAQTRETEVIGCKGAWITVTPCYSKKNTTTCLPAYLVPMIPPLNLQPNYLQESVAASESTTTQIFGVMHITLTGLIDSMVPSSCPWAILGKSLSCIVKLVPILLWALPSGPVGCLPASSWEPLWDGFLTKGALIGKKLVFLSFLESIEHHSLH
ncbi:hypothetical protein DSO57_1032154 [Entomophthora muscae]|uniref:Uncharacterized protein n=1 Tax=Entomophthora muscae TaxID=34485 RepID=A0ACC2TZX3_9FUNG|nr:hypothetical protein DSO57_1032154 [Entomophthora muscae]